MPKRKVFQIGNEIFASQKDLEERCKMIKNNNLQADICEMKDVTFLRNLLLRHPNSLQKFGVGLKKFSVRKHGKDFCFWITRTDETSEDFSYISCITPPSNKSIQNEAFRNEIRSQIQEFKQRSEQVNICPLCKLEKSMFHIDHHTPLFHELITQFNLTQQCSSVETEKNQEGQIVFLDRNFANHWIEYHQRFACLRIICSECNLSRLKKTTKK